MEHSRSSRMSRSNAVKSSGTRSIGELRNQATKSIREWKIVIEHFAARYYELTRGCSFDRFSRER